MIIDAKIRVLLIDDDLALGCALSLAIENSGYNVQYISNLYGINTILKEYSPHIIVLDVEVGDRNSIDVIPQIRLTLPSCTILMISSYDNIDFITNSLGLGALHYLKKPFKVEELIAYLKKNSANNKCDSINIGCSILLLNENKISVNHGYEIHDLAKLELLMLKLLISNYNKIVTRDDIVRELYKNSTYSEHSINNTIAKLRKILSSDNTIDIVTIHKTGYKLCCA